jgi:hypothetical protein
VSSRTAFAVALTCLVALADVAAAGSAATGGNPQSLIAQATAMVRAKQGFSKAVLLEADGTATRPVTSATGIKTWRFVFDNQATPKFKYRSAFVYYRNGGFGKFNPVKSPFLEDRDLTTIPRMTLAAAVAKLRATGHRSGFLNVTLRWPFSGGGIKEPLYIFGFRSGKFIGVGTRTGRVRPIS